MRILFVNGVPPSNKGTLAILKSAKKALEQTLPRAQFGALITPSFDATKYGALGIEIVHIRSRKRAIFIALGCILWRTLSELLRKDLSILKRKWSFGQYDIFIDVSGNCFRDSWGLRRLLFYLYPAFIAIILKKDLIFYGQTMGPFTTRCGELLARFVLRRAKLITVREAISRDILRELGIRALLTTEPAFILEPSFLPELQSQIVEFKGESRVVGISLSQSAVLLNKWPSTSAKDRLISSYVDIMAQVVDYLVQQRMARIMLVPHTYGPGKFDDRVPQSRVAAKLHSREKVLSITHEYEPEELKGAIGKCWIFIGTRMHANIAALSQGIPTIAVRCDHKTEGIMKQLGMERYLVDFYTMRIDDMVRKIDDLWDNRERISQMLQSKMKAIRGQALYNAELVREYCVTG